MKSTLVICLLALFATQSLASTSFEKFFDNILKAVIRDKGNEIDPLHEEDHHRSIGPRLLRGMFQLDVDIKNIEIRGLKTVHRSGSASQSINQGGNKMTVVHLAISNMETDAHAALSKRGVSIARDVEVSADVMDFVVEFEGNKTSRKITVPRFEIFYLDKLQIKFKGEGITDRVGNVFLKHVLKVMRGIIISRTEKALRKEIEAKVDKLPDNIKNLLL